MSYVRFGTGGGDPAVGSEIVRYAVDSDTEVLFEVDSVAGFAPAGGPNRLVGKVRTAMGPAVELTGEVLDQVRQAGPDEAQVKLGVKK